MSAEEEFIRLRLSQLRDEYYAAAAPLIQRLAGIRARELPSAPYATSVAVAAWKAITDNSPVSPDILPAITNAEVAVDPDYFWRPMDHSTPRGVKLQLLSKGGVATHGQWDGKDTFWEGWTPLPKRRPK